MQRLAVAHKEPRPQMFWLQSSSYHSLPINLISCVSRELSKFLWLPLSFKPLAYMVWPRFIPLDDWGQLRIGARDLENFEVISRRQAD